MAMMTRSRYMRGFLAGSLLGIAAGVFLMPHLDKGLGKRIVNSGRSIVDNASGMVSDVANIGKR
jgi:gas vesicle protein